MFETAPTMIIIAGPNGIGKSTFAESFFDRKYFKEFVNTDEIAKGLSPFNPTGQKIRAGKLAIERVKSLIQKKETFGYETTLAGSISLAKLIMQAKKAGFHVRLYYLYSSDVRINLKRIKLRVEAGGHNIPAKDVRRRYKRSIQNLFKLYKDICDLVQIYDLSEPEPRFIASITNGKNVLYAVQYKNIWKKIYKQANEN